MSNDFSGRAMQEFSELQVKVIKLRDFICSEKFETLPDIEQKSLREQLKWMTGYQDVLSYRVSRMCGNA